MVKGQERKRVFGFSSEEVLGDLGKGSVSRELGWKSRATAREMST